MTPREIGGDASRPDPSADDPSVPAGRGSAVLVLVRHGASAWSAMGRFQGSSDPPLSELGVRQARALGDRLADRRARDALGLGRGPFVAIRHSPLARAAGTARIIAQAVGGGVPLTADVDLRELSHGAWEGSTHADVRRRYPDVYAAWRADPSRAHAPGGEPLAAAAERAALALARALDDVRDRSEGLPDGWGMLVGHDGIFRLLLLRALGLGPMGSGFWALSFAPCAISILERDGTAIALRCHNVADHLDDL